MTPHPAPTGVVVELAGLPGAGKSTIAALTRAALAERGVPCTVADAPVSAGEPRASRARRRLALGLAESVARPAGALATVRAVTASGQQSVRDGMAGALQWLVVQRLLTRARSAQGVHLLEEGPVQTLWTLALRAGGAGDDLVGPSLTRLAPAGTDLVVVVDAPVDEICPRLDARASRHSRTQRLPAADRAAELDRGGLLLEEVLRRRGGAQLRLANDGRTAPEELARQAADRVLAAVADLSGRALHR